jgi:hypothetical protein
MIYYSLEIWQISALQCFPSWLFILNPFKKQIRICFSNKFLYKLSHLTNEPKINFESLFLNLYFFLHFQINLLQRNSFQWFHENDLPMDALSPVLPIRPQLMSDLRSCITVMIQSHEELVRSQTKFQVTKNRVTVEVIVITFLFHVNYKFCVVENE